MSLSASAGRPHVQRLGLTGIGAAVLLVGIASPAVAATGVVIPLEPTEIVVSAFPVENFGGSMDPMADPSAMPAMTPVDVRYSGTITVDIPAELDDSAVGAELVFDDNGDGIPEATYSSSFAPANPNRLIISGQGTGSITVTLPADDPIAGDAASLYLEPLASNLGPAFDYYDPIFYELAFDPAAPAAQSVMPELIAYAQYPCGFSATPCSFPTAVTAGSTVVLDLSAGSVLRELGLTDLTGVELALQQVDASGFPTGTPTVLPVQVTGSTASFVLPAGTAAGTYALVVAQQTPSGGISILNVQLTVEAEAVVVAPPAATPAATPAPAPAAPVAQAVVLNAGLRSNTGVEAVETGSTGTAAVATGAGLLALAGAGGVALARGRRRPSAEGGSCGV